MKGKNMNDAKTSWNTIYQSTDGFECQITLRDEDETRLADRIKNMMASIIEAGGTPLKRRTYASERNTDGTREETEEETGPEKSKDVYPKIPTRCNKKLKDGHLCGFPLVERRGRFGPFMSCPNYKEHAS